MYLERFSNVSGLGLQKMKALAQAFPTEESLEAATEESFRMPGISKQMAKKLYAVKDGAAGADYFNGERRTPVWNTISMTKVSGAQAPKESEAAVWLDAHSATHELYNGTCLVWV